MVFCQTLKVKIFSACVGGVAAGILWYHTQWAYINFQIGVSSYNKIYGVFATLPIFLLWLYLNWIIVLLGAEISFAVQNYRTYSLANILKKISVTNLFHLACVIVTIICRKFKQGKGAWNMRVFQRKHNLPAGVIEPILEQLGIDKIIIRIGHNTFVPGKDPDDINLDDIYVAICGHRAELKFDMTSGEKNLVSKINHFETDYINNLSTLNSLKH